MAIEKYCKTDIAYGGRENVNWRRDKPMDKMESFFLSETLKYLYLLQDPDSEVDILHKVGNLCAFRNLFSMSFMFSI